MANVGQFFRKILYYVSLISVEPIGLLAFMAFVIQSTVSPQAEKYRMIDEYCTAPSKELPNLFSTKKNISDCIQKEIVLWNQIGYGANTPIAMIVTIVLSALGDKHGRQINILFGLLSLILRLFVNQVVYAYTGPSHGWQPLWLNVIGSIVTAFFGDYYIAYASSQAFMVDTISDKKLLTIRLNVVNVCRQFGLLIGSLLVGQISGILGFARMMLLGLIVACISFFYALFRIPQIAPKRFAKRQRLLTSGSDHPENDEHLEEIDKSKMDGAMAWIKDKSKLFRDTWQTFAKKREGHKRFFIISVAIMQFVQSMSASEAFKLVAIYTLRGPDSKSPGGGGLDWKSTDLGNWSTYSITLGMIGSLGGIFVFKKIFKWRDTTVIVIGLVSQTLNVIPIALASYDHQWPMYVAPVCGMFYGVISPTLSSFVASLVSLNEVGKVYTAFAMTGFLAGLMQMFVLNGIYIWSLEDLNFPPLMWYLTGGLSFLCTINMAVVHFMSKKEHVGEQLAALNEADDDEKDS